MALNIARLLRQFLRQGPSATDLPTFGAVDFPAGHIHQDAATGAIFVNVGHNRYSIHTDKWSNRYYLEEKFLQLPQLNAVMDVGAVFSQTDIQASFDANKNFEILGTGAVNTNSTFATGGGIKLTTAAGIADQMILRPHVNPNATGWAAAWRSELSPSFDCVIKTGATASMATQIIWAGLKLTNTSVTATDDDQTFFRFQDNSEGAGHTAAVWECIDSASGTDNIQSSGLTVAIDTQYWLHIQVDGNLVPRYYINGALKAVGKALTTAKILIPFIGIQNRTTSQRRLIIRELACGMNYDPTSLA